MWGSCPNLTHTRTIMLPPRACDLWRARGSRDRTALAGRQPQHQAGASSRRGGAAAVRAGLPPWLCTRGTYGPLPPRWLSSRRTGGQAGRELSAVGSRQSAGGDEQHCAQALTPAACELACRQQPACYTAPGTRCA